jgi:hypothetical protein
VAVHDDDLIHARRDLLQTHATLEASFFVGMTSETDRVSPLARADTSGPAVSGTALPNIDRSDPDGLVAVTMERPDAGPPGVPFNSCPIDLSAFRFH